MVEETFFRKHAKKIFVAGTIISIAGLIYVSKKYGIELKLMNNKLEIFISEILSDIKRIEG